MTTWTPATPDAPGDVVLGPPALVEPDFTWPELLTKAATLLLVVATGFVIVPHILTFQPLADSRQIGAGISLTFAAMLFDFGVDQVLDWRRKRRARVLPLGWKVETEYSSLQDAIAAGWIDPTDELQRHLTDALAVMLTHPQLTVDAGTLKLLAPAEADPGR